MIVVLADDFSGAAEIAGVATRHGLAAEVQTDFDSNSVAEVVVVDTDTRSLTPDEAAARVGLVAAEIRASRPSLIFKKVDSLLRGPVLAEIEAVRHALETRRVVLAVSNPSLGRVVSAGKLYVHESPVADTDLARDPEHPILSSDVMEILQALPGSSVRSIRADEPLPDAGVCVADATSGEHLTRLAQTIDSQTLAVGAAEFFAAILDICHDTSVSRSWHAGEHDTRAFTTSLELLVCGSRAAWTNRERECQRANIPVLVLPATMDAGQVDRWLPEVKAKLLASRRAMVGLGQRRGDLQHPHRLAIQLARQVAQLVRDTSVTRLLVEGGATASALVRELGWSRLQVVSVPAAGVVELEVRGHDSPKLLVKPGSYDWPASVYQQFLCERDHTDPD